MPLVMRSAPSTSQRRGLSDGVRQDGFGTRRVAHDSQTPCALKAAEGHAQNTPLALM